MNARIVVVDDHQIMREGVRLLLHDEADLKIVGNAFDTEAGWHAVNDLSPDLVIMDLDVPGTGGVELTTRIRSEHPEIKVVVLTAHAEPKIVDAALRAGATGYVLKTNGASELVRAVRAVLSGEVYLCPEASSIVVRELQHRADENSLGSPVLSTREIEVLTQIADGYSTKEIAFALKVSTKTVEAHRANLMKKIGVNSVAQLTKYALREGLTTL